jgi:hypothetical protein
VKLRKFGSHGSNNDGNQGKFRNRVSDSHGNSVKAVRPEKDVKGIGSVSHVKHVIRVR